MPREEFYLTTPVVCFRAMKAKGITPILNVSDIAASFAWFEKWGWKKAWDWGTPPRFGAVYSGEEVQIFLCQDAQGGRGKGMNTTTFQVDGDEAGDKGAWMSVWVEDVDAVHRECVAAGLDVTFTPRSEEHTSELQSPCNLVCRLLLEKKKRDIHRLPY